MGFPVSGWTRVRWLEGISLLGGLGGVLDQLLRTLIGDAQLSTNSAVGHSLLVELLGHFSTLFGCFQELGEGGSVAHDDLIRPQK